MSLACAAAVSLEFGIGASSRFSMFVDSWQQNELEVKCVFVLFLLLIFYFMFDRFIN